jgi:hypothetical protein
MQESASDYRYLCSELVTVEFADGGGERSLEGNLEEISEERATVLTNSEIPSSTAVRIRCEAHWLRGVVESASYDLALGYFHEIVLDDDSRWSEERYRPMHLLKVPLAGPVQ